MSHIFISHKNNPEDNAFATRLREWITNQKGIDGFVDFDVHSGIQAGDDWEDRIYAEMNRAQVVIALISPTWLASDWCMSEARMARLRGVLFLPMIIAPCRNPFPDTQAIDCCENEARAFEQLKQRLATTFELPPPPPYPGMAAFRREYAGVYFGRDAEIRDLRNQLEVLFQRRPETPRFLLVLGASGSGKSSVVRAGVLPRMESDPNLLIVDPLIPAGDPLGELLRAIRATADRIGKSINLARADLASQSTDDQVVAVLDLLERVHPAADRVLLTIDQAEELLRGGNDGFFAFSRTLVDKMAGRLVVMATMRSDFLNAFQQCGLVVGDGTRLSYRTFTLDPLPQVRLGEVIREPARRFGVT